jgi:hypothetical protein
LILFSKKGIKMAKENYTKEELEANPEYGLKQIGKLKLFIKNCHLENKNVEDFYQECLNIPGNPLLKDVYVHSSSNRIYIRADIEGIYERDRPLKEGWPKKGIGKSKYNKKRKKESSIQLDQSNEDVSLIIEEFLKNIALKIQPQAWRKIENNFGGKSGIVWNEELGGEIDIGEGYNTSGLYEIVAMSPNIRPTSEFPSTSAIKSYIGYSQNKIETRRNRFLIVLQKGESEGINHAAARKLREMEVNSNDVFIRRLVISGMNLNQPPLIEQALILLNYQKIPNKVLNIINNEI